VWGCVLGPAELRQELPQEYVVLVVVMLGTVIVLEDEV